MAVRFQIHQVGDHILASELPGPDSHHPRNEHFANWDAVREYFLGLGATAEALERSRIFFQTGGSAMVEIGGRPVEKPAPNLLLDKGKRFARGDKR